MIVTKSSGHTSISWTWTSEQLKKYKSLDAYKLTLYMKHLISRYWYCIRRYYNDIRVLYTGMLIVWKKRNKHWNCISEFILLYKLVLFNESTLGFLSYHRLLDVKTYHSVFRGNPLLLHRLLFYDRQQGIFIWASHKQDRIVRFL